MRNFLPIFIVFGLFLAGCRAKLETSRQESRRHIDEIGVVLRKADSLCSTIAEKQTIRIEYYPPSQYDLGIGTPTAFTGSPLPAAPFGQAADSVAPLPWQAQGVGVVGGLGAVKSIEITTEKTEDMAAIRATDSVSEQKTDTTETRQEEKASQARQDNGTVIGLAIVAAVAVLVYFLLKSFFK